MSANFFSYFQTPMLMFLRGFGIPQLHMEVKSHGVRSLVGQKKVPQMAEKKNFLAQKDREKVQ